VILRPWVSDNKRQKIFCMFFRVTFTSSQNRIGGNICGKMDFWRLFGSFQGSRLSRTCCIMPKAYPPIPQSRKKSVIERPNAINITRTAFFLGGGSALVPSRLTWGVQGDSQGVGGAARPRSAGGLWGGTPPGSLPRVYPTNVIPPWNCAFSTSKSKSKKFKIANFGGFNETP